MSRIASPPTSFFAPETISLSIPLSEIRNLADVKGHPFWNRRKACRLVPRNDNSWQTLFIPEVRPRLSRRFDSRAVRVTHPLRAAHSGRPGPSLAMQSEPGVVRLNSSPSRRPGCLRRHDGLKTDRKSMSHPPSEDSNPSWEQTKSRTRFCHSMSGWNVKHNFYLFFGGASVVDGCFVFWSGY